MRRPLTVAIGCLAMTGTLLILPVTAETAPEPEPVSSAVEQLPLGSVQAPAPGAEVQPGTTEPVPGLEAAPTLTLTQAGTAEFSAVGVTWVLDPAVVDVVVKLRVQDSAGAWGQWTELAMDGVGPSSNEAATAPGDQRGGTEPVWSGPSYGAEVEVLTRSGATPLDVQLVLIDPRESAADTVPAEPEIQDVANAAATMPPIYSRAQWGADESIMTWPPEYAGTIKAATVHHTADANGYPAEDVPRILRSIYQFHSVSRGWGDIGYNVLTDRFGRLWEGRAGGLASTVIGAHAGGFNSSNFGVSMLGNYDVVDTPQAMIDAVGSVIAWKLALYGVNPRGSTTLVSGGGGTAKYPAGTAVMLPTIMGHRDVGNTTCPGQYGYVRLGEIRNRAAGLIGSVPGDVSPVGVSAMRASGGQMTMFARGMDSAVYFKSSSQSGQWGTWTPIPHGIVSGPPTVIGYGNAVDIVARGFDGTYWGNFATLNAQGQPAQWRGWYPLPGGGMFSTAPAVASAGPNLLTIVGRGLDGALWQLTWNGSRWSSWATLGGVSQAAPTVHARTVNGAPGYVVYGLALNSRINFVTAGASSPGALSAWATSGYYSRTGAQADAGDQTAAPGGVLTTTNADSVVGLTNTLSGRTVSLAAPISSRAAMVAHPDGSVFVFARGMDNQMWATIWYPNTGPVGRWWPLGGVFQ